MIVTLPDGKANLIATLSFLIIDTVALILRFISKRKSQIGFRSDDWWILSAYLVYISQATVIIYDIVIIAGTLQPNLIADQSLRLRMLKLLWIGSLHYPLVITAVKLSILCLYHSMFTVQQSFRIAAHLITGLCISWGIATMCLTLFGCKPISAAYNLMLRRQPSTQCVPYGLIVLSFELSNALLDVAILALPIFVIRILHLPLRKKLMLTFVFWLGGFVIITCILRIVYSYDPKDPEHFPSFSLANEWLMIEEGSAIVAACLPTFRPLLTAYVKFPKPISNWFSSSRSTHVSRGLAESCFSNGHLHDTGQVGNNKFDEDNTSPN